MDNLTGLIVLVIIVGGIMFVKTESLPRGIRNKNPLNIRENQRVDFAWEGEHLLDLDGEFEEFIDPRYGYRAATRILQSYARRNIKTLEDIISTWAPSNENDTENYISVVEKRSGINRYTQVSKDQYADLFAAMTLVELGQQPYPKTLIEAGIALA